MDPRNVRKYLTAAGLVMMIGVMTVLVAYSPTLYRLFCQATGFGGATQRVAANTSVKSDTVVTVFFDANVAPNLPWRFTPAQRSARLRLGETAVAFFEAENYSDHDIVGRATFNVTPEKAGIYFKKIQCFCFTEERLAARAKAEMPVQFFVDPRIAADPGTRDVDQITLSYTFFRSENPTGALDLARFSTNAPDTEAGQAIFASQCSGCHALDKTREGPPLAGVIGRKAGSIGGYPYSPALAQSGIVWSEETLEKWLAGPRQFVPGALMPMAVPDAAARRAIIAYLRQVSHQTSNSRTAPRADLPRPPG